MKLLETLKKVEKIRPDLFEKHSVMEYHEAILIAKQIKDVYINSIIEGLENIAKLLDEVKANMSDYKCELEPQSIRDLSGFLREQFTLGEQQ